MNTVTILQGHVLGRLRELPENSVHCLVTSPPYWGLRDYGTEPQVWGGEPGCGHEWEERSRYWDNRAGSLLRDEGNADFSGKKDSRGHIKSSFCRLCGTWRGSYGLEPTIELYVQHTVEIFRELRRVLRKDGVCFLNLGDSYWSDTLSRKDPVESMWGNRPASDLENGRNNIPKHNRRGGLGKRPPGLKPKDLCGIPWRVALALQADGWWLRSDIIWAKPNPMPESVTDRPTRSHEYIFLLTKSGKYFWDQEAVREPHTRDWTNSGGSMYHPEKFPKGSAQCRGGKNPPQLNPNGRNLRSVWNIATQPFPEAHFATFPQALVEKCIKAGCPEHGVVLDPFMGSGTTCLVAAKLQRDSIGIELKPEYVNMARKRIRNDLGILAQVIVKESAF